MFRRFVRSNAAMFRSVRKAGWFAFRTYPGTRMNCGLFFFEVEYKPQD